MRLLLERFQVEKRHAFTLIEVIIVLSLIGVIIGMLAPVLNGALRGSALRSGGNTVTHLIETARQVAMTRNTMTALVLLAKHGVPEDFRAFTALEYQPGSGWAQTHSWTVLPEGVVVDVSAEESSFLTNSPDPFPFLLEPENDHPPVYFRQRKLSEQGGFAARIFMPSGALRNSESPAQIRLVEGYIEGENVVYTHRRDDGRPANYYEVAIVGATGVTKISRP